MKAFILAVTAATIATAGLAATSASATPLKKSIHGHHVVVHKGKVTRTERAAIRRSHRKVVRTKAKIYADGKVTPLEKIRLQRVEMQHKRVIRKALR